MKHHILVIEDDAAIRRGLVDALKFEGFSVMEAGAAPQALEAALSVDCHLILLDLMLPGGDGLSILKQVRQSRPTMPVIILTARGDESDRVQGLRLGADDYVVKPFSVKELLARVHAVLRRSPQRPTDVRRLQFQGGHVDLIRSELLSTDGRRHELTQREVELLRYLASHADRPIARDELLRHVWGIDPLGSDTRTVDMTVARLRAKLSQSLQAEEALVTVRGRGYTLTGWTVEP